jgi:hypothetical protein
MAHLRPVLAARHASPATFVHRDLEKCTHVFIRQDTTRRALEPLYSDPYQVLSRREDAATPHVREAHHCVSRQGQAGLHRQDRPWDQLRPASRNNPGHSTTSHVATALHKNYTLLRSPHPFPLSPKHLSSHLHGGDVGIFHSVKQSRAGDIYTLQLTAWPSVHPHKRYRISAHRRSSSAHWLARLLAAMVFKCGPPTRQQDS